MIDTSFDSNFEKSNKIRWYPYVGKDYTSAKSKVLIVGDSHYISQTNIDKKSGFDIAYESAMSNIELTRHTVLESAIKKEWLSKTLTTNLYKLLLDSSSVDDKGLWSNLAFCNIVQRPMNYVKSPVERPQKQDFSDGWMALVDTIKILKPNLCIIFGLNSTDYFNLFMMENNIEYKGMSILRYKVELLEE